MTKHSDDRLIVALDVPNLIQGMALVDRLGDSVSFYKIGLGMLTGGGLALANELKQERGKRVFLDMKLFDIGATIEAAVRREVLEESGIEVGEVSYLSSQPWPFPASLMLGCRGEAITQEITLDPNELQDARWVTREELVSAFAGTHPLIKPSRKGAIAQFIMQHWLADTLD